MKIQHQLIFLFAACMLVVSCHREQESVFSESPSERTQQNLKELKKKLVSSEKGWKMTYFPNIDKKKFSDINYNVYTHESALLFLGNETGVGGFTFWIKFLENGTLEMKSDFSETSEFSDKISDYQLSLVSGIQLSFITHNYIHSLVNPVFKGSSDFVYSHTHSNGNLIFKTATHPTEDREYIVLEKIESNADWEVQINNSKNHKQLFEDWEKPVLTIKNKSGEVVFKSNYSRPGYFNPEHRYALFIKDHTPESVNPVYFSGVGSGYSFTEKGMFFNAGLTYDDATVFKTFSRKDEKFVCEVNGYTAEINE